MGSRQMNDRLYTLLYTLALTVVFVAATSVVDVTLRPGIELNARLLTRRVIVEVSVLAPPADGEPAKPAAIDALYRRHFAPITGRDTQGLYILAVDGGRSGYVFRTGGRGYWDRIEGYVGVDAALQTITGIAFTKHVETPGLGGEITKPWFRRQFVGKALPRPEGEGPIIEFVEPGAEPGPSQVHAITGATRTSTAVETFFNRDLRTFLKVVEEP